MSMGRKEADSKASKRSGAAKCKKKLNEDHRVGEN
jgi:hypothetical protein